MDHNQNFGKFKPLDMCEGSVKAMGQGKSEASPTVSIGMPVYNGDNYIRGALDSLLAQTYTDFELIISDNGSTDGTEAICREYVAKDSRIRYVRQPENRGGTFNFKFVLDKAQGAYFMWAAHDDIWHEDFIQKLVMGLDENSELGMAFCNIVNIDSFGRVIRTYPSFKNLENINPIDSIVNYLRDPEILGKANLTYSIYRTQFLREAWNRYEMNSCWGSDMIFVFGCLCATKLYICDEVLFYKRIVRNEDSESTPPQLINIHDPERCIFPYEDADNYINGLVLVAKGTIYENLAKVIMLLRKDLLSKTIYIERLKDENMKSEEKLLKYFTVRSFLKKVVSKLIG